MTFKVGDIPFFEEYVFTDTGTTARHFALVLAPETATQYQGSLLCCVITSKNPKNKWSFLLKASVYDCFIKNSYACFNRKDLVPKFGLSKTSQPKAKLTSSDLSKSYKILKKSLYAIKDLASDPFLRGTIIYEWKKKMKLI
jgi:hypothetical protein